MTSERNPEGERFEDFMGIDDRTAEDLITNGPQPYELVTVAGKIRVISSIEDEEIVLSGGDRYPISALEVEDKGEYGIWLININLHPIDHQSSEAILGKIRAQNLQDESEIRRLVYSFTFSSDEARKHICNQIMVLLRSGALHQAEPEGIKITPVFTYIEQYLDPK